MLLIVWRIGQVALLGAIIGYAVAGHGAIALGALLALVVGALWELERRLPRDQRPAAVARLRR